MLCSYFWEKRNLQKNCLLNIGLIILKIANHISRDFDLVAFSHANLRTFQIISKASLIWKQRLDPEDQNYCLKMKSEFGSQELSCPEKEMFFRRSNSERNMRKAKFNIIDDQFIYDVNMKLYSSLSVYYRDFYVHHWYNPEHMHFTWVDLSKKGGLIQTGILSRKIPDILGVKFINILCAHFFVQKSFWQLFSSYM